MSPQAEVADVPDPIPTGYRIAERYSIEAEISSQPFGRLYRARDLQLNETVALVVLSAAPDGPGRRSRFRAAFRECFYRHRGSVYEYGEWEGVAYASVRYVEGVGAAVEIGDE